MFYVYNARKLVASPATLAACAPPKLHLRLATPGVKDVHSESKPGRSGVRCGWTCGSRRGGGRSARGFTGVVPRVSHVAGTRNLAPDMAAKVDASDLVQETFLAASRDIAQFHGRGPDELRFWLKGILQHLMANTRRRYRGTRQRQLGREMPVGQGGAEDVMDLVASVSTSATSPSGRAMRRERADALHEGLLRLPEHYRQVIQWHHQERLPFEAIAGRLGVSPEAARKV